MEVDLTRYVSQLLIFHTSLKITTLLLFVKNYRIFTKSSVGAKPASINKFISANRFA